MIETKVTPEPVIIERTALGQNLSFEFLMQNTSDHDLHIQQVAVSVYDSAGNLELRQFVNTNGIRPGIETLGERTLAKHSQLCVFNPFHTFQADFSCHELRYVIHLTAESGDTYVSQTKVSPESYETKSELYLPIRGRLLVLDGHDFYAHHRRVDLTHPILEHNMGLKTNSGRFAYDFCPVNALGELHEGEGQSEKDWYGFREPVHAPADGKVVALENRMQDNVLGIRDFDFEQAIEAPDKLMGNYVTIDHLNGEFSVLAHFKQGSVSVQKGETVDHGQFLGQIGFSGSTGPWVHLHYELRTGIDLLAARGLPAYFNDFFRIRGQKQYRIEKGHFDTGEILESRV